LAKKEIIEEKILKALEKANASSDELMLLPVSRTPDASYQPKVYSRLNSNSEEFKRDLANLQPTVMHVSMHDAMKRVQKILATQEDARVTLHVVSDFRMKDWAQSEASGLHELVRKMAKSSRDFKVRLIDVAHPEWEKGRPDPICH